MNVYICYGHAMAFALILNLYNELEMWFQKALTIYMGGLALMLLESIMVA